MSNTGLYFIDEWIIAVGLFILLIVSFELGYRLGLRARTSADATAKSQAGTIEGAVIGVLALLLAFTLSMSISRFDTRRQLVLDEANAIGTTYLRAKLLPAPFQSQAADLLRQYVSNRLDYFGASLDQARLQAVNEQAGQLQHQLWAVATAVSAQDNHALTTSLFVQTLNDTIDLQAKRLAATRNTVPETVIVLLFGVSAATAAIIGYNSGLSNRRHFFAAIVLIVLITAIILVLIDLDRPSRGLIQVSQQSMIDLQDSLNKDTP